MWAKPVCKKKKPFFCEKIELQLFQTWLAHRQNAHCVIPDKVYLCYDGIKDALRTANYGKNQISVWEWGTCRKRLSGLPQNRESPSILEQKENKAIKLGLNIQITVQLCILLKKNVFSTSTPNTFWEALIEDVEDRSKERATWTVSRSNLKWKLIHMPLLLMRTVPPFSLSRKMRTTTHLAALFY